MKFVLLIGAVLLGAWLWRSGRRPSKGSNAKPEAPSRPQVDMVRCLHCAVHLPAAEAQQGRLGPYCSTEHRQLAEP
jgi:uncharacterized protein